MLIFRICLIVSSFISYISARSAVTPTVLDSYIKLPDASYHWDLKGSIEQNNCKIFFLQLTSQTWRPRDSSAPVWQHWLTIVRPNQVRSNQGLLFVGGGNIKDKMPTQGDSKWIDIATRSQSVVVELRNVPNQPLIFNSDGKERYEDDAIAYTWDQFMRTQDPTWNIRFPMVKSVVRAMDAAQEFLGTEAGGKINVEGFVLSGASKRGWAVWLSSAIDNRVTAIVPMVIDILNVPKFLEHHYASYGFWAPALHDHQEHQLIARHKTPEFAALMEFEDPFNYRARLTHSKLIISASGDQFFLVDSSRNYFSELAGENYLRILPNTGHHMQDSDNFARLANFYIAIIRKQPLPRFSWNFPDAGSIKINTLDKPIKAILWVATNPKSRDFRIDSLGKEFKPRLLSPEKPGYYHIQVPAPIAGYTAFFVELHFSDAQIFTTEASVVGQDNKSP